MRTKHVLVLEMTSTCACVAYRRRRQIIAAMPASQRYPPVRDIGAPGSTAQWQASRSRAVGAGEPVAVTERTAVAVRVGVPIGWQIPSSPQLALDTGEQVSGQPLAVASEQALALH